MAAVVVVVVEEAVTVSGLVICSDKYYKTFLAVRRNVYSNQFALT